MYILFDIGGTHIRVTKSDDGKVISEVKKFHTPKDFDEGIKLIIESAKELSNGAKIDGAAGGIREVLDKDKTKLVTDLSSSIFPDWVNKPLKEMLEDQLGCPVSLENDAVLAALGEATDGAGKTQDIVAFFTLSTGFGGARIVNKKIDAKAVGFEPGDLIVGFTDKPVYLENLISGAALEKKYGRKPTEIEDKSVWELVEKYLSVGLYNVVSLWSPNIIVLGGPLVSKISLENVNNNLKNYARKYLELPKVVEVELDGEAGLYGALAYLSSRLVEKVA